MKNNVFTDPIGWATKAVGTSFRYRVMQLATVLFGLILAIMFYLVFREARLPIERSFGFLIILVVAAIQFPLFYLRALRFLVLARQTQK